MPRPIHFEIPAENPERLITFYQTVFGWKFQKWEGGQMPYWLITTGPESEPGINGGLMPRHDPQQPCVNTIGVTNLDEMLASAVANGGKIALPKMPVPGIGWLGYIQDPEGHILGMMQPDPAAK
jgi:uncharacterized protein